MLKKILLSLVLLAVGIGIGFKMPRGAGLIATIMSFDQGSNQSYSHLKSHQALIDFESMLTQGRKMVLADARTEQEAIEGMRWLLRVAAMSAEVVGDANAKLPHFQRMDTLVRKVGGDNPDAEYERVAIDGRYDYKITGTRGSVSYIGFTITAGEGMNPRRQVAYVNDLMLNPDEEGNFTLWLTKQKPDQPGDWVEIPEDASGILVRQYIGDRKTQVLPELNIEIVGDHPAFQPPTDEEIANAIIGTTYAFLKLSTLHQYILPELLEQHNGFIRATSENLGGAISSEDNLYMIGSYQLEDDEVLVIDVQPPNSRYWNLALETRWHETPDYLHRSTSLTKEDVKYNDDGSVQFVVSHKDPGHPNWLDTSGHNFGFMTFRWLDSKAGNVPMPVTEVVKISAL